MSKKSELFSMKQLYDHKHSDALFIKAVKENIHYHQEHNSTYADMLNRQNFSINQMKSIKDLYKIPPIPTLYFKSHKIVSMPSKRIFLQSTSSGTSGKKSHIGYDGTGLLLGANMIYRMTQYHQLCSKSFTNYIIFGYQPHKKNKAIIAKTAFAATFFAPAIRRVYAIQNVNGHEKFNYEAVKRVLLKYQKMGKVECKQKDRKNQKKIQDKPQSQLLQATIPPVRLIGFPAYLFFFLKKLKKEGITVQLPKGSMVLLGGGWKQFYTEKVEKDKLYELINEVLGIPSKDCREFFGAAEHPMVYCTCKNHHFHVPTYSRVIVRDVDTLLPVPYGTIGIMNFVTPLLNSVPTVSVMTDDLGVLHDGCECGCGIKTPYFEIIGRVGLQDIKTCAAVAGELLGGDES